jgi:Male sterility protein
MTAGEAIPPTTWSGPLIEEWLFKQAVNIVSGKDLSRSVDLFEQGFDRSQSSLSISIATDRDHLSLSATFFRRRITGAMRSSKDIRAQKAMEEISQDLVYKHPTIQKLASYIDELVVPSGDGNVADPTAGIEEMIEKYSANLEGRLAVATSTTRPSVANIVLLTGSTGNLGSSVLASLLEDPRVKQVYAFNRGNQSMLERHTAKFTDRGLDVTLLRSDKVAFISGDIGLPSLGLDSALYDEVRLVIHLHLVLVC